MASIIRIKRSSVSGNPATLGAGELAYSALTDNGSNGGDRLYIGIGTETSGNAANHFVIGGKYFTDLVSAATNSNTASAIVKRDASGNFSAGTITAALSGTASTATALATGRTISLTGDVTYTSGSFDGTGNVTGTATLANTAVTAGSYGSSTAIPVFTVDSKGRLTAASTAAISSALSVAADSGTTDVVTIGTDTLTFTGGTGLDSVVSNNAITFNIDSTVATLTGSQTLTNKTLTLPTIGGTGATFNGSTSGTTTVVATATAGTTTLTLPAATDTLVGKATTDTLTNKTIAAGSNTISGLTNSNLSGTAGITNANLANSSVTIGSTSVSLGATVTTFAGLASVTSTAFVGALTGNASTATTLQTARAINGVNFDGSAAITVTAAAGTLSGSTLASGVTASSLTSVGTIATGVWQGTAIGNAYLANSSVTIGSTSISLGSTSTSLAGVTELTVDNINVNGNTISSTDTNGNIIISPNGTGKVDVSGSIITGLSEPVGATDAATKNYVDTVAEGLHVHEAAHCATTNTLAVLSGGTVTYNNGTSGVGATLTLSAGLSAIDGHTLTNGDRILVKNQATQAHNGMYVRTSATVLTRSTDFDTAAEIGGGDFTFVENGTTYGNTGWVQTVEVLTVGTDNIIWQQFSGTGTFTAGSGLTIAGTEFNVGGTADRITVNPDSIDIASTYVGQSTITTLGTIGTGTWQGTIVAGQYGGTGVNNSGKTITIGGNFTHTGAHTLGLTTTANTSVTLPTTGTLATLAGSETLTNKTITGATITTGSINNTPIGASTTNTGAFTTLAASGAVTFTATTDASNLTTAAVILSGGLSVTKAMYIGTNITGAGAATSTLDGFNIDGGTY